MPLQLDELAKALDHTSILPQIPITSITSDSRKVQPGTLFVAYRGVDVDGHRFIPQALAAGAVAVVGEVPESTISDTYPQVPYLRVENGRRALGILQAAWQGWPSSLMGVIGVTGTDGKTTTCNIIHSLLSVAGYSSALLTTVGARIADQVLDTGLHVTTPASADLQRYLRVMADAGVAWTVLETTSHGLSQWRVAGVHYDLAVITNVTHEHLDEHGDYDHYLAAKGRLLELVAENHTKPHVPKAVILNADDRSFQRLRSYPSPRTITYGIANGHLQARDVQLSPEGVAFTTHWGNTRTLSLRSTLRGTFNVYNILAAVAVAFVLDLDDTTIQEGLARVPAIPGRMEAINLGQDFDAIVDFAHTPFALEAALRAARNVTNGRIIVIFGSAGLRDVAKRRMMGEIAAQLADLVIVTAEDPRTEDLDTIIADSVNACREAGGRVLAERDRYRAMQLGLAQARPGDLVIVCGKGHEQSMCFGDIEYPWDDRIALTHALEVYLGLTDTEPPHRLPTYEAFNPSSR